MRCGIHKKPRTCCHRRYAQLNHISPLETLQAEAGQPAAIPPPPRAPPQLDLPFPLLSSATNLGADSTSPDGPGYLDVLYVDADLLARAACAPGPRQGEFFPVCRLPPQKPEGPNCPPDGESGLNLPICSAGGGAGLQCFQFWPVEFLGDPLGGGMLSAPGGGFFFPNGWCKAREFF